MMPLDLREWGVVSRSGGGMPATGGTPEDIPGLLAWFDPASDYVTKSGSPELVSSFVSREGNGYTLTVPVSVGAPQWSASGILGNPALRFPSSGKGLSGAASLAALIDQLANFTIYSVFTAEDTISSKALAGYCRTIATEREVLLGVSALERLQVTYNAGSSFVTASNVGLSPNYAALFFDGSAFSFRLHGSSITGTSFSTSIIADLFTIGYRQVTSADHFWQGYIGDTIVYDHVLTPSQITILENWITGKYAGI